MAGRALRGRAPMHTPRATRRTLARWWACGCDTVTGLARSICHWLHLYGSLRVSRSSRVASNQTTSAARGDHVVARQVTHPVPVHPFSRHTTCRERIPSHSLRSTRWVLAGLLNQPPPGNSETPLGGEREHAPRVAQPGVAMAAAARRYAAERRGDGINVATTKGTRMTY